jgi:type IV pilus assembly protein PilE
MKAARQSGFTLIELMITVAIIGILASIAWPSYTQYVLESRRAEAQADMLKIQLGLEKWRANQSSYASVEDLSDSVSTPADQAKALSDANAYYTYTITGAAGSTYTINAAAQGAQTADSGCTGLTLNQSGAKTPSSGCWKGSGS